MSHSLLDELQTPLVLTVEILCGQPMSVVHNAEEITHTMFCGIDILRFDMSP